MHFAGRAALRQFEGETNVMKKDDCPSQRLDAPIDYQCLYKELCLILYQFPLSSFDYTQAYCRNGFSGFKNVLVKIGSYYGSK